jgi:hypothetical protein
MKSSTRLAVVLVCSALCAGGIISESREQSGNVYPGKSGAGLDPLNNYQLAASDLNKFSFAQLETIIRADVAAKSPHARVEFGSVKVENGALVVQVLFFGKDRDIQAFLYNLVPNLMPGNNGWRVARVQRLWFVPRAQLLRGLRV